MEQETKRLKGKTALIIGGSSESGPAICETLAKNGANITFTYYSSEGKAKKVADKCRAYGVKVDYQYFDLHSMEQIETIHRSVCDSHGRLDIHVNIGGPPPIFTNLRDVSVEEFDEMMNTHFKGYFFLGRNAAKTMEKYDGGLVINVSATSFEKYDHSVYGIAKASLNSVGKFLAYSFAPNVRIITLIPGLIELDEISKDAKEKRRNITPLQRLINPTEIGEVIVSLTQNGFHSVTGETLLLDGGFHLSHT